MKNSSDEEFRKSDDRKVSNYRNVDEHTTGFWYYVNILCCGCFGSETDESDDKINDEFIPYSYGSNVPIMSEPKTSHITTDKLVTTQPISTSTHSITKSTDETILMDNIPILNNEESKEQTMTKQELNNNYFFEQIVFIQRTFRVFREAKTHRNQYLLLREKVVFIQRKFRTNKQMKAQKHNYQLFRQSVLKIQRKFRANQMMKIDRNEYLLLREKVIFIQRKFRTNRELKNIKTIVNELLEEILIRIQTQFTDYEMESESIQSIITISIVTSFKSDSTE